MQLRAAALAILIGTVPAAAFELAPTADPLAREIVATCSAAIAAGALPTGDGWQPSAAKGREIVPANAKAVYADKEVEGVGLLHLRLHASVVEADALSSCAVTIANPQRQLPLADFGAAEGLLGSVDGDKGVFFAADSSLFVSVLQQPAIFSFAMDAIADAQR